MNPSTSLGTTSNVGTAKPAPSVRQTGNIRCLLVMYGVCRSSVARKIYEVNSRRRCRVIFRRFTDAKKVAILTAGARNTVLLRGQFWSMHSSVAVGLIYKKA